MQVDMKKVIPLPVVIMREGKWYVAPCPIIDVVTQGKTEKELRENMRELIDEYFKVPDTPKPKHVFSVTLTSMPVDIEEGGIRAKTKAIV